MIRPIFLTLLLLTGFFSPAQDTIPKIAFESSGLDGKTIKFPDPDGRLVVVNFWSVYCRVCVKEIPELNKLIYQFSSDDIIFIAVSADSKEEIQSFLSKHDYLFTTSSIDKRSFIELSKQISGSIALPFTAIIDRKGKVLYPARICRRT